MGTAYRLPESLSIYLDLVRFGAAVVVVLHHAWPVLFPAHPLPWPGHQAVVVFFVLSGLVISHATQRKGLTFREYAVHRCARIWSVAIPALLLSAVVSIIVAGRGLTDAAPAAGGWLIGSIALGLSILPLGQLWYSDINPPLDAPFWSLNFEIWYYVMFGAWQFMTGYARAITLLVVVLIVGPKILLLLPIWLLGVALHRNMPHWPERTALAIFLLTAALALAFIWFDVSIAVRTAMVAAQPANMAGLGGANEFAGDWLLALIVVTNFGAAACLGRYAEPLHALASPIRALASVSFSTYLYHMPLLAVAVLALGLTGLPALILVAVGVTFLAMVTERQLPAARHLADAWLRLTQATSKRI